MQNLFSRLPHTASIDGKTYALRTDWRTALRIFAAMQDDTLADFEKQGILLSLLYETVPQNIAEAMRIAALFLNCGKEDAPAESTPPLYDFAKDAPLIYAAMQKSHGIDVLHTDLHWWQFCALFCDIGEDTFFARILYLRRGMQTGTLPPAEKRAATLLHEYMALPQNRTVDAQADEFMKLLKEGTHGCNP